MGAAQLKEELYQFIERGDNKLIKMLYAVAKEYSEEDYELTDAHKAILDERLADYEANPTIGSSWKEVKARIKNKL